MARPQETTQPESWEFRIKGEESDLYRTVFIASNDGIVVLDATNRILDVNPAAEDILGKERDIIRGEHYPYSIDENDRSPAIVEITREDGSLLQIRQRVTSIPLNGASAFFVFLEKANEPTPPILAALETRQSLDTVEERLTAVLHAIRVPVICLNPEGALVFANRCFLQQTGYTLEQAAKQDFSLITREEQAASEDDSVGSTQSGRSSVPPTTFLAKDGTQLHIVWTGCEGLDVSGNFHGRIFIGEDVTARKKVESAIRERERMLGSLVENLPGIAYRCKNNRNWTMDYISSGCYELTGYQPYDLIGDSVISFNDLIHPDDRAMVWNEVHKRIIRGESFQIVYRLQTAEGSVKWVWEKGRGFVDSDGRISMLEGFITEITPLKLAETSLRQSVDQFRETIENSEAGYFSLDAEGNFIRANKMWLRLHRFEDENEIVGRPFSEVQTNDGIAESHRILHQVLCGKSIPQLEMGRRCKDGSVGYNIFSAKPLINLGRIVGVEGFVVDITERKKAELALQRSEEHFRLLFDSAPDLLFVQDADGTLADVNRATEELTGMSREELVGQNGFAVFCGDQTSTAAYLHTASKRGVSSGPVEVRYTNALGKEYILELRTNPLSAESESLVLVIGRDVTVKRHAEQRLRELSKAVEHSPVAILITDASGIIEYINPRFTSLTGYTLDEVRGKRSNLLKSGVMDPAIYRDMWKTILHGKEWRGELINKTKSGTIYWEDLTITPILNDTGQVIQFLGVSEDITTRKRFQDELRAAKDTAERADRFKDVFMANISHEIRTPLNIIMGYNELLESYLHNRTNPAELTMFQSIGRASKRLLRTVNQLLSVSAIQSGSYIPVKEPMDLCIEIDALVIEVQSTAREKGLDISVYHSCESAVSLVDRHSVEQAIVQLMDNAIKFTSRGEITVRITKDFSDALIEIQDTGSGISEEYLPRLFDLFSQEDSSTSRVYQGLGVGLALARRYIDINNGSLSISSEKGKGTTASIRLPLAVSQLEIGTPSREKKRIEDRTDNALKTMLLIDENETSREYLRSLFSLEYQVVVADNGVSVINLLNEHSVDLVLLDCTTVGVEKAIALCDAIFAMCVDNPAPILAIVDSTIEEKSETLIDSGFSAILKKPFRWEEIRRVLKEFSS